MYHVRYQSRNPCVVCRIRQAVFFDAIVVKVPDGQVANRPIYPDRAWSRLAVRSGGGAGVTVHHRPLKFREAVACWSKVGKATDYALRRSPDSAG